MITVACVEWENYLGRGAEYVAKLKSMVTRHLHLPHQFVCVQPEEPQFTGWWRKLELFKPGRFTGRVMYLDLDTVIVGPLAPLVAQTGAVHLSDWGWTRNVIAGGMLVWDAGEHEQLYTGFAKKVSDHYENDQEWMTVVGGWNRLSPHLCRSYRYHCKSGPPPRASVVAFHGRPKPHEILLGWVPGAWR